MSDFFNSPYVRRDENARTLSYFCTEDIVMIDKEIINQLIEESKNNGNCDIRLSLHKGPLEEFHNMIILQNKDKYYRPNKHENKVEVYHLIKGKMAVFLFGNKGSVKESAVLSPEKNIIYRIPQNTWHVSIPLTDYVIFNESKPGPFLGQKESIFADWAPDGSNPDEGKKYFASLLGRNNLQDKTAVIEYLIKKAKQIRKDAFNLALEEKDGHIAPSFSIVEILVVLYEQFLKKEDRFILSKGHGCLTFYIVLRHKGFNPKISGHPDIEREQGIECTTGSLGHGLPIGVGMAFAKKFMGEKGHVFVLIGDGECQEGTVWESLNLARKLKLDNLTIIVDHNKLQALDTIKSIIDECPLNAKFEAFGCDVVEIDGHDFNELIDSLDPKNTKADTPKAIIAHTIKGKGISFMENTAVWHSKMPEGKLLEQTIKELE